MRWGRTRAIAGRGGPAYAPASFPPEAPLDHPAPHPALAPERAVVRPRLKIVLAGALLSMTLAALDQNIVNTALPRLAADLGGLAHLSWVVTAFMLTATITTPLYGKLSDLYGRRRLFFVAIGVFLLGSALCGAADSMWQIIAFRAIQGLGAGGLLTLAMASVGDVVSPRERPRYQGWFTGTFALGSVAGPLLGGAITSLLSWRWVFYVNLPVGVLALAMIAAGLRTPPAPAAGRHVDYGGALLLAGATTALLLWLAWGGTQFPWVSAPSLGMLAAVAALSAGFVAWESRVPEPLVRLRLFRNGIYARGVGVSGMMAFAMMGSTVFLPLYFQLVLGMSPGRSGAMMLPQVVGMVLTSVLAGPIVARMGRNRPFLLAGIGLELLGLATLAACATLGASAPAFLFSMAVLGCGMGMGMPNLTTAVQNAVAHRELGAAMGALSFVRSLGAAVGVASSGAIMSARLLAAGAAGTLDARAIAEGGAQAMGQLRPDQVAGVANAYRTALTGCFGLSTIVMTGAFVLVLSLKEQALRSEIGD